ncbi:MAG TPA: ABC transporter permease [Thermoanaerobaculia bacterium]|nr:ABC transporter permease [Thermoanaerobaculia bacterium]
MRLWEIFRYDLGTQLRRYPTLIYAAGLVGMTLLAVSSFFDDARRDGVLLNAPVVTAASMIIVTMVGLLVTAALAGEAATRDLQARMEPLLYTTPVSKATYLGGRFLSAFAAGALLLLIVPLTLAASRFFPGVEPAFFGPFRPGSYLHAYLIVGLPNAFITTALLFSLVVLTRKAMLGYLGGAALFMNSLIQDEIVAGLLGRWDLAKLFDPFGFMATRALWRSWTTSQRNTLPLELEGALLTNRLLWIGVSLVALLLVYARFRMAHYAPARRWWQRRAPVGHQSHGSHGSQGTYTPSRVRGTFDRGTRVRQVLAIALRSYREMITSRAALILPGIGLLLFKITPELIEVALGTPGRPATGRLALLYIKFSTIGIFVGALIAFFAGQLVWRERDARENDIADAAPVPDALSLAGKFAGLAMVLVTLQAVVMAAGIATQISQDYNDFEPLLYLRVLFGLQLADYLLFAALAMAVHVVVNQKYVAMAIAMLAWLWGDYAGELGIEHNLLIFGSAPAVTYSDISGFGASIGPWLWFKLYWGGWALLFALLARLFWVRGHEARRIAVAWRRFTRVPAVVAAVAVGIIVIVGGFVFYNTNVLNEYTTDAGIARRSAEYERRYGRYADLAQPVLAATKLHVELQPAQRRADVRGTYRLENRSGRPIDTVHLVLHRTIPTTGVTFDRPARATVIDRELGYRIYTLGTPLAPGDSVRLDFAVGLTPRGFTNRGISAAVAENGTFLENRPDGGGRTWLPAVGYRRGVELDNAFDRRAQGLPLRPAMHTLEDTARRNETTGIERVDLETIIGTDADQIAVAPGALRRSWTERGRRYFHYATDAPIRNGLAILSARYAVHRARWQEVDIEVLHHPKHAWNAERFARAARASLDSYSRELGPYPYRQLRLIEFPSTGGNRMTAHPGTIVWSEAFGFAQPETDWRKIDFPFAVVAHEVAHQWWGNQVVPARVEGAPLVSESLSWYSAMMVVEETFGREHFDRVMGVMRESYLTPNATPEVPLLRANDWLAVYRTGALAMHALREAIGEERVNTALHRLVAELGSGRPPFATSLDLYRQLRAVTPAEAQPLLKDLFEEITFWDLRMKSVRAERAGGGAYRVTLDVEAYKVRVGSGGREQRVPLDDTIEVAVFDKRDAPLYLRKHPIRSGLQSITVTVPQAPASAGIDPDFKLLDRKRDDNVKDAEVR